MGVTLRRTVRLRGAVVEADGRPVAGEEVRVLSSQGGYEILRVPDPVETDGAGRFEFSLSPNGLFRVEAGKKHQRVRVSISTLTPGDKEVQLRFLGSYSIQGFVLDHAANPAPGGRVSLWESRTEEKQASGIDLLIKSVKATENGSFRIEVERTGNYQLIGQGQGFANSQMLRVGISDARPHADVRLPLLSLMTIGGVVKDQNGDPIRRAKMFIGAETGEDPMWADRPTRHDLFERVWPIDVAEDGTFHFDGVHPNTTYTITCCPDPEHIGIKIRREGVTPGTPDLEFVLSDSEVRGTYITGAVVDDRTGSSITDFRVKRVYYREDGAVRGTSNVSNVETQSGRFCLPGLSLGIDYTFVIQARGWAPVLIGPIRTISTPKAREVRLERLGSVLCRITDEKGKPVVGASVGLIPAVQVPSSSRRSATPTKLRGVARVLRLSPGEHTVYVQWQGALAAKQRVDVVSAQETEVEIVIAR